MDSISFPRDEFTPVNIILLARSVHFTALTKPTIRLFHFLEHLFTDQTRDHILSCV